MELISYNLFKKNTAANLKEFSAKNEIMNDKQMFFLISDHKEWSVARGSWNTNLTYVVQTFSAYTKFEVDGYKDVEKEWKPRTDGQR